MATIPDNLDELRDYVERELVQAMTEELDRAFTDAILFGMPGGEEPRGILELNARSNSQSDKITFARIPLRVIRLSKRGTYAKQRKHLRGPV